MDLRDVTVRLWVPRSQVALLVAMVESYESLGVVRIVDAKKALAEIYASPSFLGLLLDLLQDLSREGISVNVLEISR
ncbi:MAG TPA: DUF4911 domain-containing protein [Thermosulfidibacter takaii]|uniref:DUF4911 domain-containing protein n=1 Tax=Thermosulfidibacter takaii TaxID=412593 RepID=A0A7C0Y7K4_9BACT|nr:DUF4911 domain-containing protein [Thermosulfidibacter takaii]